FGDFNQDGTIVPIDAYFDRALNKVVPWRDFETVTKALPFVSRSIATFRAYSTSSVEEILGARWSSATQWQANTLDSMVFLNRGDHLEGKPLPIEAQFAPAFGVAVGDLDGDGNQDLVLAQNFFDVEPETSRYDAGRGLWLRGDGHGGFVGVPGQV